MFKNNWKYAILPPSASFVSYAFIHVILLTLVLVSLLPETVLSRKAYLEKAYLAKKTVNPAAACSLRPRNLSWLRAHWVHPDFQFYRSNSRIANFLLPPCIPIRLKDQCWLITPNALVVHYLRNSKGVTYLQNTLRIMMPLLRTQLLALFPSSNLIRHPRPVPTPPPLLLLLKMVDKHRYFIVFAFTFFKHLQR